MGGMSGYGAMRGGTPAMGGGKGGSTAQPSQMSSYTSSPFGGSQMGSRAGLQPGMGQPSPYSTTSYPPQRDQMSFGSQMGAQQPMGMGGGKGGMGGYGGNPYGQAGGANPAYGIHNQFMSQMQPRWGGMMPGQVNPGMMGQQQAAQMGLGGLMGGMGMFGGNANQQALDAANQNAAFQRGVAQDYSQQYPGLGQMPTLPEPASQTAQNTIQRVFNRVGGEGSDNAGERDGRDRGGMGGLGGAAEASAAGANDGPGGGTFRSGGPVRRRY